MKLYCFRPGGHGEQSFFVMSDSEENARTSVRKYMHKEGMNLEAINIFNTDYYSVEELNEGEVAENDNG